MKKAFLIKETLIPGNTLTHDELMLAIWESEAHPVLHSLHIKEEKERIDWFRKILASPSFTGIRFGQTGSLQGNPRELYGILHRNPREEEHDFPFQLSIFDSYGPVSHSSLSGPEEISRRVTDYFGSAPLTVSVSFARKPRREMGADCPER